jgi:starch phosphorylase
MENENTNNPVAYFCAEFGYDTNVPIYAGGLGVLSGDTIKAAADMNTPFVGIGLLYRGYGTEQKISNEGLQTEEDNLFDPTSVGLEHVYLDEMPLFIKVHLTEIDIWVRVWKKSFSDNVTLYLLDTQTDQNLPSERSITSTLYSGTQDTLLKQQLILGIGGIKLLNTLGIKPSIYHMNEGRPNFLHWEVIRQLMTTHEVSYAEAKQTAISKTVYTNHTLVAAGNQSYPMELLSLYSKYYAEKMNISVEELLLDGIANQENKNQFSVTQAALNTSFKANGVSEYHSNLSQELWPNYNWCNVTNGVHMPTWQDASIIAAHNLNDPKELWEAHKQQKRNLSNFVGQQTGYTFNPDHMVISWARRIAGYKRFDLIFSDIERLRAIIKNSSKPVQILLAGKAHSGDTAGKQTLQKIIQYMQQELSGNALFIPNYNIEIAQKLTRGSDLWLNTPILGKEASGTSGMKAISNGVLNLTTLDGWTKEVNWDGLGWTLNDDNLPLDLYEQLEQDIIPLFYNRNEEGIPEKWIQMMQASITESEKFSSKRMLKQYLERLYHGNPEV